MATVVVQNDIQLNELLPMVQESAYTSMFITPREQLNFTGGKTFKFKQLSTGGYKPSSYTSGVRKEFNQMHVTMTEQEFEMTFGRDFEHNAFVRDIETSGNVYDVDAILEHFMITQDIPETDAYFFSTVATKAKVANLAKYDLLSGIDNTNVLDKIDTLTKQGKIRTLISQGACVLYVSTDIMDILARTDLLSRFINVAQIIEGHSITTRIVRYNNLPIIEVVDGDRFYDAYDFTDGFVAEAGANKINMLLATPLTTKTVIDYTFLNILEPGTHSFGYSFLTQMEKLMDVFCFNNGLNNQLDSIAVSIDAESEY